MDCEDKRAASFQSGWVGNSYSDGSKNVLLQFCLVDDAYFGHDSRKNYALLDLGASFTQYGPSQIIRYFDNEDKNNKNNFTINGVNQKDLSFGLTNCGSNSKLGFMYYPSFNATGINEFPNLGISYGVFGRFGANQGCIFTDDEDSSNANWANIKLYNSANGNYNNWTNTGSIPDIMDVGGNTKLYMSKVY